jgi:starch phosphorylase
LGSVDILEREIEKVSDAKLWQMRATNRMALIRFTRERLVRELAVAGAEPENVERVRHLFDPNALTLGFARRFATYKRPNLLLRDPERLLRILTDPRRPAQLLIAGKAHPADQEGQELIHQWIRFIVRPEARPHVVFLSDYDMLLTEHLVQGVDVWLNTPRRPWEACGTSGMKALVNGALNLSELDGWWAEAFTPEVGWALGDGQEHGDDPANDDAEAEALYTTLEQQVVPEFYARDQNGIPVAWVARMRRSMARLTPQFSATRAVREYAEKYYLPAATTYLDRAADKGAGGARIVNWQQTLNRCWESARFGEVRIETSGQLHNFEAQVFLDEIDADSVKVELYAEASGASGPVRREMTRARAMVGSINGFVYSASVPDNRPAVDYTPRIVPYLPGVAVPLEASQILWQR